MSVAAITSVYDSGDNSGLDNDTTSETTPLIAGSQLAELQEPQLVKVPEGRANQIIRHPLFLLLVAAAISAFSNSIIELSFSNVLYFTACSRQYDEMKCADKDFRLRVAKDEVSNALNIYRVRATTLGGEFRDANKAASQQMSRVIFLLARELIHRPPGVVSLIIWPFIWTKCLKKQVPRAE